MITSLVLQSIGSEEPSSFNEILRELGDDGPPEGMTWREFLMLLETLEHQDLITISRTQNNRIDCCQLTDLGTERVKEIQARQR